MTQGLVRHFVRMLSGFTLDACESLVRFDATSLLAKVPIPVSVAMIQYSLSRDYNSLDLAVLVEKWLTSTNFLFQGDFYKQSSGTPMG